MDDLFQRPLWTMWRHAYPTEEEKILHVVWDVMYDGKVSGNGDEEKKERAPGEPKPKKMPARPRRIEVASEALTNQQLNLFADLRGVGPLEVYTFGETRTGRDNFSFGWLDKLPAADLPREIAAAGTAIERWTGVYPPAFAWTYAWNVINREAWDFARQRHGLVFSPCPGIVEPGRTRRDLVWRTNVEADTPAAQCRFLYSGLVDPVWRSRRASLARELSG